MREEKGYSEYSLFPFHMTVNQGVYLALMTASLVMGIFASRYNRSLRVFPFLLGLSLATEILVMVFYYHLKINYNIIYHMYIPLEYSILAYFFYGMIPHPLLKKTILASIPLYVAGSILLSVVVLPQSVEGHPGMNFNLEGLLLITWSITALLTVEPVEGVPLRRLPLFWICLGILVFHAGIFSFNGAYNYLREVDVDAAERLNQLIIKNLNYVLYTCFIIAFICSVRMRKYMRP